MSMRLEIRTPERIKEIMRRYIVRLCKFAWSPEEYPYMSNCRES